MSGAVAAVLELGTVLSVSLSAGATVTGASTNVSSHDFGNNTATASGGAGGYTYSWAKVLDLGGASWASSAPTSATTDISVSSVSVGVTARATYTCTVTDRLGATAQASTGYTWKNVAP